MSTYKVQPNFYKLNHHYPEKNFNLKKLQLRELNVKFFKLNKRQLLLIQIHFYLLRNYFKLFIILKRYYFINSNFWSTVQQKKEK